MGISVQRALQSIVVNQESLNTV